jgi:DNA-binding NarL/FixJ family response regulator
VTVRLLVVDDQQLIRDGIASVLSVQEGIEVVGCAADGAQAVAEAARLAPEVILMDIRMPVMDGVRATGEILRGRPGIRVLMLTTFDDEAYVLDALHAGACGYLLKDLPAPDLARAVRLAARGVDQYDPAATRRLAAAVDRLKTADRTRTENDPGPLAELTRREADVLRLIAGGATNREIGRQLFLSEGTVKNHVSNILARLGLRDRTQAALHARDRGWL